MVGVFDAIKKGFGIATKSLGLVLILIIFNLIGNLVSMPFAVPAGQTPTPQMMTGAVIFTIIFLAVVLTFLGKSASLCTILICCFL